jgi:hypothetical protein
VAAGAGLGLLVAAAVSVKANAVAPGLVLLGVILVAAAARRDRRALAMGLTGLGTLVLAAAAWLAAVALPNWDRLATAVRIWPTVEYLGAPATVAERVGRYLADADGALGRSLPLLLAAGLGLAALVRRWPGLRPATRDTLVMGALWGVGLWLAVAVGDYLPGHYIAPNRYVVPALPGLAVLAGFGLASVAALAGRRSALAAVAGVVLGLAVAVPGVATYLDGALASGRAREQDQRALAAALPADAVVYGAYAPTLLFDTRLTTLTPWPAAGANVRDPVGRLGVTHVLIGPGPADPTGQVAALAGHRGAASVARVPWGPGEVVLYALPGAAGAGLSPVASPIDYDPQAGPFHQR